MPYIDKSSYQLSYCNQREALREIVADIDEGADIVMVKPTLTYLDLLPMVRDNIGDFPIALQLVSGEFAMIKGSEQSVSGSTSQNGCFNPLPQPREPVQTR